MSVTFFPTYSFGVLVEATIDAASPRILLNLQSSALAATRPFGSQSVSTLRFLTLRELELIPPGYLSCWSNFPLAFFPLKVSEIDIPFGLLRLAKQLVPCFAPANILARLRLFVNTVPTAPFKVAGTRIVCYRAVPPKNDRRRPIEGEIDR
ncbi:hypothetical protein GW17_00046473 [Ensete ventricosum]|nr:hypothetical protein GW17_00046473 [Ensete ventricosum]